jgi:hypothetical protein
MLVSGPVEEALIRVPSDDAVWQDVRRCDRPWSIWTKTWSFHQFASCPDSL